jgi:hypothetical protein
VVQGFSVSLGGMRLSPLGTTAIVDLLYQPRMIDDDYGAVGGMRIGRGNRSTRRKPAPVPLCPPQIPHDLGSNPGRRGGKPATNRLNYGTALWYRVNSEIYEILDFDSGESLDTCLLNSRTPESGCGYQRSRGTLVMLVTAYGLSLR